MNPSSGFYRISLFNRAWNRLSPICLVTPRLRILHQFYFIIYPSSICRTPTRFKYVRNRHVEYLCYLNDLKNYVYDTNSGRVSALFLNVIPTIGVPCPPPPHTAFPNIKRHICPDFNKKNAPNVPELCWIYMFIYRYYK